MGGPGWMSQCAANFPTLSGGPSIAGRQHQSSPWEPKNLGGADMAASCHGPGKMAGMATIKPELLAQLAELLEQPNSPKLRFSPLARKLRALLSFEPSEA